MRRFLAATAAVALLLYGATFLTGGRASGEWLSAGRETVASEVMLERRRPVAEPSTTLTPVGKAVPEQTAAVAPDHEAAAHETSPTVAYTPRKREPQARARHSAPAPTQVRREKPTGPARMAEPVQFGLADRG